MLGAIVKSQDKLLEETIAEAINQKTPMPNITFLGSYNSGFQLANNTGIISNLVTSLTDTYQVYELRRKVAPGTATCRSSLLGRREQCSCSRRSLSEHCEPTHGAHSMSTVSKSSPRSPGEPGEQEDLIGYIDLELDALMARVQLISYRYILL